MESLLTEIIGEYRYEVFFDNDGYQYALDMDFENEEQKEELIYKLQNDLLIPFGIEKSKKCACCDSWNHVDSLWGMLDESAEKALKDFIEHYDEKTGT